MFFNRPSALGDWPVITTLLLKTTLERELNSWPFDETIGLLPLSHETSKNKFAVYIFFYGINFNLSMENILI